MKKAKYNWIPSFVYGGIDGAVTTFAVVAGVVGAELSTPIILILGSANLLADGFSMAASKYSADKAEIELIQKVKEEERLSIKEKPEEEKAEVRQILRSFGFRGRVLRDAEEVITANPRHWVHLMMHHEFHLMDDNIKPKKGAFATFLSFLLVGLIPLAAYLTKWLTQSSWNDKDLFIGTCVATLLALFIVGTIKSRFTRRNWFLAGLETAAIGGSAAAIAYLVGYLLRAISY